MFIREYWPVVFFWCLYIDLESWPHKMSLEGFPSLQFFGRVWEGLAFKSSIFILLHSHHLSPNHHFSPETAAAAKSLQSCPTLCNPIDSSPLGSSVPGILQARILEWVAISFSNAWKWKVKVKSLSPVRLFATPWTAAYQAPPSMGFSRQEYWSGVPLPSPLPHNNCSLLLRI